MQMSDYARKVEDAAHALNNFILKWDKLHSSGITIINCIKNLKTDCLRKFDVSYTQMYPKGLQGKCYELEALTVELETAINSLQLLVNQLNAICQLDHMQNKCFSIPFNSWSTEKFRTTFQAIYSAYSQELTLKNLVRQEIAHCSRKDSLLLHVAAWESQPFLDSACSQMCKTVLLETGVVCLTDC